MNRQRVITENKFKEDSDISRYWLGYIAADGCISKKHNDISIKSKDKDHLQKLNSWLGGKINMFAVNSNIDMLKFSNKEIKEYLIEYGITPVKSLNLKINKPLTWAFVRGLFDGDGNFRTREGSAECKITSASMSMLTQLNEFFLSFDIVSYIRLQSIGKNPCYCINISGKDFEKFYKYMYKDADVFLERKHLLMRPVFEKRQGKLGELLENPVEDNQQPSQVGISERFND